MKNLHHNAPEDKPYLINGIAPELPITVSLIQHRYNISPALARLIVRENFGGEA